MLRQSRVVPQIAWETACPSVSGEHAVTLGGRMASVQENLSHLPAEDLQAIGAYLKTVPALPDAVERSEPARR